jgi:hypothetical protein
MNSAEYGSAVNLIVGAIYEEFRPIRDVAADAHFDDQIVPTDAFAIRDGLRLKFDLG